MRGVLIAVVMLCAAPAGAQVVPDASVVMDAAVISVDASVPAVKAPDLLAKPAPVVPAIPETPDAQVPALVRLLTRAVHEKNWSLMAGVLLTLVVWVLRKMLPKLDRKWLPLTALVLTFVPAIAVKLMDPAGASWDDIVSALLVIWLTAGGAWASAVQPVRDSAWLAKLKEAVVRPAPAPVAPPPAPVAPVDPPKT
jgi:hypothetical protein